MSINDERRAAGLPEAPATELTVAQEVRTIALGNAVRMMGELPESAAFIKFATMADCVLEQAARFERFITNGAEPTKDGQ